MKYLKYLWRQLKITKYFSEKLKHNFHELTWLERAIYFISIRSSFDPIRRFFFEGSLGLPGQMYLAERQAIYDAVIERQPRNCFEIGTYTGGGSTFFLASALEKIGKGELVTMENDKRLFNKARKYYQKRLPKLNKFITFLLDDKAAAFNKYIEKYNQVDCVFFDGAEDEGQTVDQYNYFLPYFKEGSIIIMHDWNTDKMKKMKPLIVNDPKWQIIKEIEPPTSVGLAIARRIS